MINWIVRRGISEKQELRHHCGAEHCAVDCKGSQLSVPEIAVEKADGKIGSHPGYETSYGDLRTHPVSVGSQKVGHFVDPRRKDDGRCKQEREARCVLVIEPAEQAADHGYPRAADPREKGQDLRHPDQPGVAVLHDPEVRSGGRKAAVRPGRFGSAPQTLSEKEDDNRWQS